MNPGHMNGAGGYAEKSMGKGLKGVGASKAGIDGCLVYLLDRVRPQAISKEIRATTKSRCLRLQQAGK